MKSLNKTIKLKNHYDEKLNLPNEFIIKRHFVLPNELINMIILHNVIGKTEIREMRSKFCYIILYDRKVDSKVKIKLEKKLKKDREQIHMTHTYTILKRCNIYLYVLLHHRIIRREYIEYFTRRMVYKNKFGIKFKFMSKIHRQLYKGPAIIDLTRSFRNEDKHKSIKFYTEMISKNKDVKHINYLKYFTFGSSHRVNPFNENGIFEYPCHIEYIDGNRLSYKKYNYGKHGSMKYPSQIWYTKTDKIRQIDYSYHSDIWSITRSIKYVNGIYNSESCSKILVC